MAPKKRSSRVYWRGERAWGDFRDYADVGGGREPLVPPPGPGLATTDPDVAAALAAARLSELERFRKTGVLTGAGPGVRLAEYVERHLPRKRGITERHRENLAGLLAAAIEHFGADRLLHSVQPEDVEDWLRELADRPGRRGRLLSTSTQRHYLNALSGLYRRAIADRVVPLGFNPVAGLYEKPRAARSTEAVYLPYDVAVDVLRTARLIGALEGVVVGSFLYTGGRKAEVLGQDLDDPSFDRRTITFRPNRWRRLKNETSHRTLPMWPGLEALLRPWVFDPASPRASGPLIPSPADPRAPLSEIRRLLARVARGAGLPPDALSDTRIFRHTYCAVRLQTLDHGHPISVYAVAREMGHASTALVERIYGHMGEIRHRAEIVEYVRPEPEREEARHG